MTSVQTHLAGNPSQFGLRVSTPGFSTWFWGKHMIYHPYERMTPAPLMSLFITTEHLDPGGPPFTCRPDMFNK